MDTAAPVPNSIVTGIAFTMTFTIIRAAWPSPRCSTGTSSYAQLQMKSTNVPLCWHLMSSAFRQKPLSDTLVPSAPSCDTFGTHSWQNGNWMSDDLYFLSNNIPCCGAPVWLGFPSAGLVLSAVLNSWRVDGLLVLSPSVYMYCPPPSPGSVQSRELYSVTALLLTTNASGALHWLSHKQNDHARTSLMHCQNHMEQPSSGFQPKTWRLSLQAVAVADEIENKLQWSPSWAQSVPSGCP